METIVSVIDEVLLYLEIEEKIFHETVELYSENPLEEFSVEMEYLNMKYPEKQFSYIFLKDKPIKCLKSEADLIIYIDVKGSSKDKLKLQFQSHVKNVFGTIEYVVSSMNGVRESDFQIFSTSLQN